MVRQVTSVVQPSPTVEGAGVHLVRSIGTQTLFGQPGRERIAVAPALVIFGDGEVVQASPGPSGGRFLLAAARPLNEPIARHGPFVMNTREEIAQTLHELRTGRFLRHEPTDLRD